MDELQIHGRQGSPLVSYVPAVFMRALVGLCAATAFVLVTARVVEAQSLARFLQSGGPGGQEAAPPGGVIDGTASVLVLYSEARFWGDQFATQLIPSSPREADEVITSTQLYVANLQRRVSSVRLRCGSRDSYVMLYTGRATSSQISQWPTSGIGYPISCTAGTTTEVNLHADAPQVADKVASAYFVMHAPQVEYGPVSGLVSANWPIRLAESLPGGARAHGSAKLQVISPSSFKLTQGLRLDHWACTERAASLELLATVLMSGPHRSEPNNYFYVRRGRITVDDGVGDAFECRQKMLEKLRAAADSGAAGLENALDRLARTYVRGHARYYVIPMYGLSDFWLAGGGTPD